VKCERPLEAEDQGPIAEIKNTNATSKESINVYISTNEHE
jgi:hypothetical protein